MPNDANGEALHVGDLVHVPCAVTRVPDGDTDTGPIVVHTTIIVGLSGQPVTIGLDSTQVVKD